jgi:vacuolar-type H+-ATPase subunit E/Vma4
MDSKLDLSEYSLEDSHKNIIGGVFLRSNDGSILTDNSLDARIKLIFEQLLPVIRSMLFPKNV